MGSMIAQALAVLPPAQVRPAQRAVGALSNAGAARLQADHARCSGPAVIEKILKNDPLPVELNPWNVGLVRYDVRI